MVGSGQGGDRGKELCCSSPVPRVIAPAVSLEHPLFWGDELPSPGFSKLGGVLGSFWSRFVGCAEVQTKAGGEVGGQEEMPERWFGMG